MPDESKNLPQMIVLGHIHTPFKSISELPIQGTAGDAMGTVALLPQYAEGLSDLDGFDRIWVLYMMPRPEKMQMMIIPRLDGLPRGVFATRSPTRPNPIGMACVKLLKVQGCTLHVQGVDMLDSVSLVDIKPYVPRFDSYEDAWAGWLEHRIPHEQAYKDRGRKKK